MRVLVLATLLSIIAGPALGQRGRTYELVTTPMGHKLDRWLAAMERYGFHGAVLVVENGKVILRKGYGVADRGTGMDITPDTRFEVGSLAKSFTAAVVLDLQRKGLLRVQDRLSRHLPDLPPDKRGITLHHLLTHRSGLPYMRPVGGPLVAKLAFPPGGGYAFSNAGYELLARVAERVSGRDYDELLADLLERADVPSIALSGKPIAGPQARAYTDDSAGRTAAELRIQGELRGAAGIACTVDEMHRWLHALVEGDVLDESGRQSMFAAQAPVASDLAYGYGWFVARDDQNRTVYYHQANYGGFNAEVRFQPDRKRAVVFLSNHFVGARSMYEAVVPRLFLLMDGRLGNVPEPPELAHVPRAELTELAGSYACTHGAVQVFASGGELVLGARGKEVLLALYAPRNPTMSLLAGANDERSERILRAVAADRRGTALDLFSPAWPQPGAYEEVQRQIQEVEKRVGKVQEVVALGTAPTDARGSGRTTVQLRCRYGTRNLELTWSPGGLMNCQPTSGLAERRFLPVGKGVFAAFDIFSGETVECRIDGRELRLGRGTGALVAER